MATTEREPLHPTLDRIQFPALIAGVAGIVLCVVGLMVNHEQFFKSYLYAYLFWLGIPLGCLALLMLQTLTGGGWSLVIRRFLEAGAGLLPLMAILFIPIVLGMHDLYVWTHDDHKDDFSHLSFKGWWLQSSTFILRAIIYFILWIGMAFLLRMWSAQQDHSDDAMIARRMQFVSGPGLVVYGLSVTFAAVDWVMTIDPHWYSTIYGMLFIVGQGLSTICLCVVLLSLLWDRKPMAGVVTVSHFHDLGNLMLAFTMLWAYVNYSQFLIVWMGNLAEETPFYIYRSRGGWLAITVLLIVCHFALPFVLLLSRATKRTVHIIRALALFVLLMRFVDLYWMVRPTFNQATVKPPNPVPSLWSSLSWQDLVTPVAIGGVWIFAFLWQLRRRPLLPAHDPRLVEVAHAHGTH